MKDDAVERVLKGLGRVEAPNGLEGRVLRRLAERDSRRAGSWGWRFGLAGGVALVGVLAWNFGVLGHLAGEHTLGAAAPGAGRSERPKAEALGCLPTTARAREITGAPPHISASRHGPPSSVAEMEWGTSAVHVSKARPGSRGSGAGVESFPAPAEPLTEQERLLVRIARSPQGSGAQFLIAEVREAELAKGDADFDLFFPPPKPGEGIEGTQPADEKENHNEVQPKVR